MERKTNATPSGCEVIGSFIGMVMMVSVLELESF